MAFPWGGTLTHAQLAAKFGWPTVIVSMILFPFLVVWRHLIAFPTWLEYIFPNGAIQGLSIEYNYPNNPHLVKQKLYEDRNPAPGISLPAGWNFLLDVDSGIWFESFWGILTVQDTEFLPGGSGYVIKSNWKSWMVVSPVRVEFTEEGLCHTVKIYLKVKGLNLINPFTWCTIMFTTSGLVWFLVVSSSGFQKQNGLTATPRLFPDLFRYKQAAKKD